VATRWFEYPRVDTANTHGTGCTLSSAVAAYLAHGRTLQDAVAAARDYVQAAIEAGAAYELGRGHGPVLHFHASWE
jgi:hydroxymethylpyrimidine/phosphomethylpyrimidine kinase